MNYVNSFRDVWFQHEVICTFSATLRTCYVVAFFTNFHSDEFVRPSNTSLFHHNGAEEKRPITRLMLFFREVENDFGVEVYPSKAHT
jgi:hypothetical protein